MKQYLIVILLFSPLFMIGQGIFRSSNESTTLLQLRQSDSLFQPLLNTAVFQLGDKPLEYDFMHTSSKGYFFGLNTSAKSNSSIASIFKNRDFVLGYKGVLSLGKVFYLKTSNDKEEMKEAAKIEANLEKLREDPIKNKSEIEKLEAKALKNTGTFDGIVLFGNVGLEGRGFYNYIRGQSIDNEIISQSNTLTKYTFGINYFSKNVKNIGSVVLGAGLNFEKTDNFKELKEVSITNTIKSKSTIDTTFSREIEQTLTAFEGEYKDEIRKTSLLLDLYLVPNFLARKIGFALNYQFNSLKDKTDTEDVNIGLYFIEEKDVFNPSFAINFKFSDVGHKEIVAEGKSRFSISVTKQINLVKSK